jgi:hypothetical protein
VPDQQSQLGERQALDRERFFSQLSPLSGDSESELGRSPQGCWPGAWASWVLGLMWWQTWSDQQVSCGGSAENDPILKQPNARRHEQRWLWWPLCSLRHWC